MTGFVENGGQLQVEVGAQFEQARLASRLARSQVEHEPTQPQQIVAGGGPRRRFSPVVDQHTLLFADQTPEVDAAVHHAVIVEGYQGMQDGAKAF